MSAAENPKLVEMMSMSPNAAVQQAALAAHVAEHLAFQYRREIESELGVPLPPVDDPMPEDIEIEISRLVAEASERLANRGIAEQQQQQAEEEAQDPILQMREREVATREQEAASKAQEREARIALDTEKAKNRDEIERERIERNSETADKKIKAKMLSDMLDSEDAAKELESKKILDGIKAGMDIIDKVSGKE